MRYTELQVTSNFTFLRGGSHPEELVGYAHALGYTEIAITDRNTFAGIVRAHAVAKAKGIRIIPACRLDLLDGISLLAYPTTKEAYASLSALLTKGNLRTEKGQCHIKKADVYEHAAGIRFIAIPPEDLNEEFEIPVSFQETLQEYKKHLGKALYLGATCTYTGDDGKKFYHLSELAKRLVIPLVATNDVHYHSAERRQLQDVLTCIREKCTIQNAGFKLHQNAERYLKPAEEMKRLFRQYPDAIARTQDFAKACQFSLDSLEYVYPDELTTDGRSPQEELVYLTWQGAQERFPEGVPEKLKQTIEDELQFIERKDYASYFLTVFDIVRFLRSRNILYQGRGSAANSTVCYCLGITSVDPTKFRLLFARFMSEDRNDPPDIDLDVEHERREEGMQYIFNKYGRDRAAIVATVTQVDFKGAVRDVAKAMGLSVDAVNRLADSGWEFTDDWFTGKRVSEHGFDPNDKHLRKVLELTAKYIKFPRQLGQHTGGFVITKGKLSDLCPIHNARMEDRTCIEWNKDDIDALGFIKVDVLALGMLTCIRKGFDLAKAHYNVDLTLAKINKEDDPDVFKMISLADTIGVFQIESRAQMSMLPRLQPRCFYDLVIEVAIVRPGPIQGDLVHPYLRRRNGQEPVEYPSKELEEILGRTLGVPLFQEQAMELAIVAAGFTPSEADRLRRSMATFKADGKINTFQKKLVDGMLARGYTEKYAQQVFLQLKGFSGYGFPESHAASFALLVYASSWLKCHYPDVFTCGLLNSMPMGFYQPAQLIIDARKHGVEVRPVDVNLSKWDNQLEEKSGQYHALRLGFRQIKGMRDEDIWMLVAGRQSGYKSIPELLDAGVPQAALEKLADADAFRSMGLDRRQALWEVSALADRPVGLFKGQSAASATEATIILPEMSVAEHVLQDYSSTALSLKAHPVSFIREKLRRHNFASTADLNQMPDGMPVAIAGLVLVRQRPGTASGICFITIEDEYGVANLVVFKKLFEAYRKELTRSQLLIVEGRVQREGSVTHVVVQKCHNFSHPRHGITATAEEDQLSQLMLSRADEKDGGSHRQDNRGKLTKPAQMELFPAARNFK